MFRVYYKENYKGLEIVKDFMNWKSAYDFLDSKGGRGYIVLVGNFKLGI